MELDRPSKLIWVIPWKFQIKFVRPFWKDSPLLNLSHFLRSLHIYIYIVSIKDQIIESETNGYSSSPGLPYVCHYPKSMRTASGLEIEIEKIYTLTRIHKEIHMYLENLFIYTFEIANT